MAINAGLLWTFPPTQTSHIFLYYSRRLNETRNDEAAHYLLVFCNAKSVRSSVTKETEST